LNPLRCAPLGAIQLGKEGRGLRCFRIASLEERFTRGALRLRQWNEKHGSEVRSSEVRASEEKDPNF